jgi:N-acetylglucosamine-6-sulfatase
VSDRIRIGHRLDHNSGNPQRRLIAIALSLGGIAIGGCDEEPEGGERPTAGAARPNVVVVLTDDQDARSLRVMPSVRRLLVRRGTTFTGHHASFPLCCPSRATLLTGQYAHNHGVLDNGPPLGGWDVLERRRDTLGVWLQRAGYRTAWIGKFLNGWGLGGDYAIPPGWSEWDVAIEATYLRMFDYTLERARNLPVGAAGRRGDIVQYGHDERDYQTDVLAALARAFVRRAAGGRPFFLVLAPLAPHDEEDAATRPRDPRPAPRHLGHFAREPLPRPPSFDEADISDKPAIPRVTGPIGGERGDLAGSSRAPRRIDEPPVLRLPRLTDAERRALARSYRSRLESLLAVDDAVRSLIGTLRRAGELGASASTV